MREEQPGLISSEAEEPRGPVGRRFAEIFQGSIAADGSARQPVGGVQIVIKFDRVGRAGIAEELKGDLAAVQAGRWA